MNRKQFAFVVFAAVLVLVVTMLSRVCRAGEYVTYADPKTGVRYYGDALPPSAPTGVVVETRQHKGVPSVGHSSSWADSARGITPRIPPTPVAKIIQKSNKISGSPPMHPDFAIAMHRMNQPLPPTRGRTARDFNRNTNAYERYNSDMLEWRMKGHDIGYKYTPTGFSEGERRYYESVGSFDRAFRRR